MDIASQDFWRKCSSCKKSIAFKVPYYVCSVSTCNGQRTGYVFCTVHCFEAHLPGARHRDAGAVEKLSPKAGSAEAAASSDVRAPARIIVKSATTSSTPSTPMAHNRATLPQDVLVIASRLKEYIQARSDMNTSQSVMDVLSEHLRDMCDRAIENARNDGRKTVMDRDLGFLKHLK